MTHSYPIAEMIESALAVLAEDLPAVHDVEQVELVLEQAGDALRGGLPLPRAVARWLAGVSAETLGAVADRWVAALSSRALPSDDDDLDTLCGAVSLRDRAESAAVGIRRACAGADRIAGEVPGFEALLATQRQLDEGLKARVSRAAAESALGIRRGLLASGSWTDALGEGEAGASAGEPPSVSGAAPSSAAPPDEVLAAYVAEGRWAAWVEGFAANSPELAESLAETIAVLREEREQVGIVARRWQQRGAGPVLLGLEERLAAADGAERARRTLLLGALSPLDAKARLIVEDGHVTVRVLANPGTLRAVRFGDSHLEAESSPGQWELTVAWTEGPLSLEVESADGRRFEVALALQPGADA